MREILRTQATHGMAVLLSSHQLDRVENLCDEVVIVHRGRAVLAGVAVVALDDHVGPQAVLKAATVTGPLTHFNQELPQLSELFRRVGGMTGMSIVRLVAARELRERSGQKSFRVSTAVLALAPVAAVMVPRILADDAPASYAVGVVGAVPEAVSTTMDSLEEATEAELSVVQVPDTGAGEVALADGSLSALVTEGEVVIDREPDATSTLGRCRERSLRRWGSTPPSPTPTWHPRWRPTSPPPWPGAGTQPRRRPDRRCTRRCPARARRRVAPAVRGAADLRQRRHHRVVEEKSSRLAEVLLSAIRPHQLLAGKVLGIGVLGLAQLVMVGTPAVVVAVPTGTELPSARG